MILYPAPSVVWIVTLPVGHRRMPSWGPRGRGRHTSLDAARDAALADAAADPRRFLDFGLKRLRPPCR